MSITDDAYIVMNRQNSVICRNIKIIFRLQWLHTVYT